MSPKLFITGATGYIGGDFLSLVFEKHPDWEITCLVRNSGKGAKVASKYAPVRLVYGDLDSAELIEEEASKADIVYHFADCDHEASARAIAKGLARRTDPSPGFWIHTSGSLILGFETFQKNMFGQLTSKVFNDWDGVTELVNMPSGAPHRNVDEIVLDASKTHSNIKTAIVCPPTIYGTGRGPDNQRTIQVPKATEVFLQQQEAFTINKSENIWHQVHVYDLSNLYLLLGEAAAAGGSPATWDEEGYYLAENGEFVWGDVLREVASVAHKKGLLPSDKLRDITTEEAAGLAQPFGVHKTLGANSRGVSLRAKKLLRWQPKEKPLMDEIPDVVDSVARSLGLIKGHAEKVLGDSQ